MSPERPPQSESLTDRDKIVRVMREDGPGGKDAGLALVSWNAQQDVRVKNGELTALKRHKELARMYQDAGERWEKEASDEIQWCATIASLLNRK